LHVAGLRVCSNSRLRILRNLRHLG
jgi:hypothetical protein